MFSKHPKGLIAAALANMGERFGFYIMMAILTLFISAKFGLSETTTGYIYSAFYASIYILALAGGVIADKTKNFKGTILVGLILMAIGYLIIAIPTPTPVPTEKPKTPPIGWLDIFKVDGKPFSLFSIFTSNKKTGIGFAQSIVGLVAMVGIGVAALVVVNHKRKKDENDNKDNHKDDSAE